MCCALVVQLESECARLRGELEEKNQMLQYVGEEVDRVKAMFTEKEATLKGERDAALRDAADSRTECERAKQTQAEICQALKSEVRYLRRSSSSRCWQATVLNVSRGGISFPRGVHAHNGFTKEC